MKKLGVLLLTLIIATLIAAIYGALHDQITYSISSEYFTVFKFDQFGFLDWGNSNPRLTTALIGVLATWWVGFYIGVFQGLLGLIHINHKLMFKYVMNAIFITIGVAIIFGFIGFIIGKLDSDTYKNCCFPYKVTDPKSFTIVGSIHNYSYVGGEIGAFFGMVYQIIMKSKGRSRRVNLFLFKKKANRNIS
jgi:hypothetical protein